MPGSGGDVWWEGAGNARPEGRRGSSNFLFVGQHCGAAAGQRQVSSGIELLKTKFDFQTLQLSFSAEFPKLSSNK